jgi:hypothetical protein
LAVEAADIDTYIAAKFTKLSPKTIVNHLALLRLY